MWARKHINHFLTANWKLPAPQWVQWGAQRVILDKAKSSSLYPKKNWSFPSIFFLSDYYKFVSIYPFCRRELCAPPPRVPPTPMDFNFVFAWICIEQGEFHFVSYMSSVPPPARPIRGMKWKFDIISRLSIFSTLSPHDILAPYYILLHNFMQNVILYFPAQ